MAGPIEHHYKLVRDGYLKKIEANGEVAAVRILSGYEKKSRLLIKIVEETGEVRGATSREEFVRECGDLKEAFEALLREESVSLDEVSEAQRKKYEELGGFEGGTFLISTRKA